MIRKRIELARVGVHGIAGQAVTAGDLAEIVETFAGSAPITIGHSLADWMPAFGKVTAVSFNGKTGTLHGVVELSDLLADAHGQGLYPSWSIGAPRRAADGKRTLHHLAFLGAVPPAVKNLKVLESVNLSEVGPADSISELSPKEDPMEPKTLKEALDLLEAEKTARIAAEGRATAAEGRLAAKPAGEPATLLSDLQAENSALKGQQAAGKKAALLAAASGRVPKAREADLLALADRISGIAEPLELADEAGKTERVSLADLLTRIFSAMARPVTEGELDLGDPQQTGSRKSPFENLARYA